MDFVNNLAHTDAIVKKRHIDAVAMRSAGIAAVSQVDSGPNAARIPIPGISKATDGSYNLVFLTT
jgi:hypothetical protein